MRRTLTAILASVVLSLALASAVHAQAEAARAALEEGAVAYRAGKFAEAEQLFRRALELDPAYRNTRLFIARAIQQQYKLGDTSPENVATAERAIAAYQDILDRRHDESNYEDAYKAIIFIYGQLKRDDKVVEMLTHRANDPLAADEARAQAFIILASRKWQCSYDVTERNKNERQTSRGLVVKYRMPADASDFQKARRCVEEGLRLDDAALLLAQDNPLPWNYKVHLLREASKLAEMEGNDARRADYDKRQKETQEIYEKLRADSDRRTHTQEPSTPPPAAPDSHRRASPPASPSKSPASSHTTSSSPKLS
jgi:tetratricopeptide (TPR) repeat protein